MLRNTLAGFAVILAVGGMVQAQTIYNDGGTHAVNGPSGPIEVLNGSTLNIDSPASVAGYATPLIAAVFGDTTSSINLNGGQSLGQSRAGYLTSTVLYSEGAFLAIGGLVRGVDRDGTAWAGTGLIASGFIQISGTVDLAPGGRPGEAPSVTEQELG